ncbi:MAG: hypothetical protein AAFR61_10440 [Bacteroidota bacterium]
MRKKQKIKKAIILYLKGMFGVIFFWANLLNGQDQPSYYLVDEHDSVLHFRKLNKNITFDLKIWGDSTYQSLYIAEEGFSFSVGKVEYLGPDTFYLNPNLDSIFAFIARRGFSRTYPKVHKLPPKVYCYSEGYKLEEVIHSRFNQGEYKSINLSDYKLDSFMGIVPDSIISKYKNQSTIVEIAKSGWVCEDESYMCNPAKGIVFDIIEASETDFFVRISHGNTISVINSLEAVFVKEGQLLEKDDKIGRPSSKTSYTVLWNY